MDQTRQRDAFLIDITAFKQAQVFTTTLISWARGNLYLKEAAMSSFYLVTDDGYFQNYETSPRKIFLPRRPR